MICECNYVMYWLLSMSLGLGFGLLLSPHRNIHYYTINNPCFECQEHECKKKEDSKEEDSKEEDSDEDSQSEEENKDEKC